MEIYTFTKESGNKVTHFNSDFVLSRMVQTTTKTNIGCIYLQKDGIVGYHQAKVPQLLFILNGRGFVRGKTDTLIEVEAGDAVYWEKGEWHETKTESGLTAIVVESEELEPSRFMAYRG